MTNNDKYSSIESDEYSIDEVKSKGLNFLRQDVEFFDDASYVPHDIINVKRISLPNNSEDWEIYKNDILELVIKGVRFTNKEKKFLRTLNGVLFLIEGFKNGWRTVSEFKKQIKNVKHGK